MLLEEAGPLQTEMADLAAAAVAGEERMRPDRVKEVLLVQPHVAAAPKTITVLRATALNTGRMRRRSSSLLHHHSCPPRR